MPSPWQLFVKRWRDGCDSSECHKAKNICLARGQVPCDILFVGEAPGESEDAIGKPFMGPAGKLLDHIVKHGVGESEPGVLRYRTAYTNMVCCIPRDKNHGKSDEPSLQQIESCVPRLQDFIDSVTKPRIVVTVGKHSREWFERGLVGNVRIRPDVYMARIVHPAFILRASIAEKGLLVQKSIVAIRDIIERMEDDDRILKGI